MRIIVFWGLCWGLLSWELPNQVCVVPKEVLCSVFGKYVGLLPAKVYPSIPGKNDCPDHRNPPSRSPSFVEVALKYLDT